MNKQKVNNQSIEQSGGTYPQNKPVSGYMGKNYKQNYNSNYNINNKQTKEDFTYENKPEEKQNIETSYGTSGMNKKNDYIININGPNIDHMKVSSIIQDSLPVETSKDTYFTTRERIINHKYVKTALFNNIDGDDLSLNNNTDNTNNILNKVGINKINPNTMETHKNPYKTLPRNTLIYNCIYPVVYNNNTSTLIKTKSSLDNNLKFYRLNTAEYLASVFNIFNLNEFDIWRENKFYFYIRDNIVKKNISPNFPIIHGYYITNNYNINFKSLEMARGNENKQLDQQYSAALSSYYGLYKNRSLEKFIDPSTEVFSERSSDPNFYIKRLIEILSDLSHTHKSMYTLCTDKITILKSKISNDLLFLNNEGNTDHLYKNINGIRMQKYLGSQGIDANVTSNNNNILINFKGPNNANNINILNQNMYNPSGNSMNKNNINNKILVQITEAPTYNIYKWASRRYDRNYNIYTMTSTGYQKDEVWYSIIFQILAALHVLHKNKLLIYDMNLENNIFIKDLITDKNPTKFWKYKINNIDYYIPNYGFLAFVDINSKDNTEIDVKNKNLYMTAIEQFVKDSNTIDSNDEYKEKLANLRDSIMKGINFKLYSKHFLSEEDKKIFTKDNDDNFYNVEYRKNLLKILNPDNFGRDYINKEGNTISDNVIELLRKLYDLILALPVSDEIDISNILINNFQMFMHNRIGKPLKHIEVEYFNKVPDKKFNIGEILVYQQKYDEYIWVLNLGKQMGRNNTNIIMSYDETTKMYISKPVTSDTLFKFPKLESIDQENNTNGIRISNDNIIETYTI